MKKPRRRLWVAFWAVALCLAAFPINNRPLRIGVILLAISAYVFSIYLLRNRRLCLVGMILTTSLLGIFMLCPGYNPEPEKIRSEYLRSLRSYEGTRYVWGGENRLGIDCSGLVRAALIKATFKQGVLTLNPQLIRFSSSLWWHDCSAKALGEEYRSQTRRIISVRSINALDETQIAPGDLAVTATGVHVLAFLGGNEWIEADPTLGRVVIIRVPAINNPWFQEPVHIMRWTELEPK